MNAAPSLSVAVSITVLKPARDVFEAILNPVPFFVEKASGPLVEGTTVHWTFPEMPGDAAVTVEGVVPNEMIRMQWDSGTGGMNTCEFRLAPLDADGEKAAARQGLDPRNATTLTISESGWPATDEGRKLSYQNQMGWMHFACSLKAWLEHGVNLRRGAFLHFKF